MDEPIHRAYTERVLDKLEVGTHVEAAILCDPERAEVGETIKHLITLDDEKVTCKHCKRIMEKNKSG